MRHKRATFVYDALIQAIRDYFINEAVPIESTDKYSNIYKYDETDESWLHNIDDGDLDEYNYDSDDDDDVDLSQELADLIEGNCLKIIIF